MAELKGLRDIERKVASALEGLATDRRLTQEAIKELLKQYGARAHKEVDGSWSVTWSTVKGRSSLDAKALEASGVDLTPYWKEGNPSERLNVT